MYPSTTNDQKNIIFLVHISLSSWTLGLALTTSIEIVSWCFVAYCPVKLYISCPTAHHVEKFRTASNHIKAFFLLYIFIRAFDP